MVGAELVAGGLDARLHRGGQRRPQPLHLPHPRRLLRLGKGPKGPAPCGGGGPGGKILILHLSIARVIGRSVRGGGALNQKILTG